MSSESQRIAIRIDLSMAGKRLDQVLPLMLPEYSRSRLQQWIREGRVMLDGRTCRPRDKVTGGERVELAVMLEQQVECLPQAIDLDIVHEDDRILVINKQAGLVVHPAAGNPDGTLQNGLLHHDPQLVQLPRAGIVHRLDKDTTGLLVVAKTPGAHRALVEQLQAREIKREYRALVSGVVTAGGRIDKPIGRHPTQRVKMAVVRSGKEAVTHYRVIQRFRAHSYLKVFLETGRTHQIRVHMADNRLPLIGDPLYAGRFRIPAAADPLLIAALQQFKRQALHAHKLGLVHPGSGEWMEWQAAVPADMLELIDALERDAAHAE